MTNQKNLMAVDCCKLGIRYNCVFGQEQHLLRLMGDSVQNMPESND
jgi:hypothetical protein